MQALDGNALERCVDLLGGVLGIGKLSHQDGIGSKLLHAVFDSISEGFGLVKFSKVLGERSIVGS